MEDNTKFLIQAAERGDVVAVQRLIPVSNPKDYDNCALRLAAENGHAKCVQLLIPVSDPKAADSWALRWAAENGHAECVKMLIPVSDPKACYSVALRLAAIHGHTDCVDLLFDVSDPDIALNRLKCHTSSDPEIWHYLEDKIAQRQHDIISQEIPEISSVPTKQRKI